MREDLGKLNEIYRRRFTSSLAYRNRVWRVLAETFFARYVVEEASVLDLGCGYGEFINNITCGRKIGMDANPDAAGHLDPDVEILCQDCSTEWSLPGDSLDVVFTSNFFEHLANKSALESTLKEARRCLKKGGLLIAMGPNIKFLGGRYWDFWDHHLPLTEASLAEAIEICELVVVESLPRFLPYTMSNGRRYPVFLVRLYLKLPVLWRLFGRQFLLVARNE